MRIIEAIIKNPKESQKEHLLHTFSTAGKKTAAISGTSFGNKRIIRRYMTAQKCIIND